jgi:hypothetical protein
LIFAAILLSFYSKAADQNLALTVGGDILPGVATELDLWKLRGEPSGPREQYLTVAARDEAGKPMLGVNVRVDGRTFGALSLPQLTLKTDAAGEVRILLGPELSPKLETILSADGFASVGGELPTDQRAAKKVFKMRRLLRLGGRAVAPDGSPVAGVKLQAVSERDRPDGSVSSFPLPPIKVAADGAWSLQVSPDHGELIFELSAADYATTRFFADPIPRQGDAESLPLAALKAGTAVLKLAKPAKVTLSIREHDGKPIEGAYLVSPNGFDEKSNSEGLLMVTDCLKYVKVRTQVWVKAEGREVSRATVIARPEDQTVTVFLAPDFGPQAKR